MTEHQFQDQVTGLADFYGWRWFHAPDNVPRKTAGGRVRKQRVRPGFPDLVLVRGPELIFAELKTDTGRVAPEQEQWIKALSELSAGVREANALARAHEDIVSGHAGPDVAIVDVYLWRPADFDELHARLARGRHLVQPIYREDAAA